MVRRLVDRFGRWLHILFEASLVFKGALATLEALAGLGLLLAPNERILAFVDWLTRAQIAHDRSEPMTTWAAEIAQSFSIQSQHFYAIYLLGHGVLKLVMVGMLARRTVWAYPVAICILIGFIIYQMHHWWVDRSSFLVVLSALDLIMVGLVWREWRMLRRMNVAAPA
ncbi:MAG: DUF2127 domain-containing protein [Rhodobacterales bacterium]|nr:DUF2127 domain-containing protein [Rhodobacterales bacterium]